MTKKYPELPFEALLRLSAMLGADADKPNAGILILLAERFIAASKVWN